MQSARQFIARKQAQFEADLERQGTVAMKDIGRAGTHLWVREAWTFRVQSNYPEKVFVLERLRLAESDGRLQEGGAGVGDVEYRLGYYIVRKIGRAAGSWGWGQYCPMIPEEDLVPLLEQARREGTLRTMDGGDT